jgi:hypothetical protein
MHFGHRNLRHKYKMNGQELQETEEEVDIGVMVTKDLKPAGQCQRAAKTAQMSGPAGKSLQVQR